MKSSMKFFENFLNCFTFEARILKTVEVNNNMPEWLPLDLLFLY